ncbi:EamA family transporter [Bacillus tuaregi]|uniref:EamA family transporter n=1 Tax=Bacillus tuaregi TaxID=1816695 RepID=UPI0008F85BCA|nr:DMT family transporter [Bacillus tuaregi]
MSTWKFALLVFLGGCSYGVVSTFVKLAYSQGFNVSDVTGTQYFFGAILLWILSYFMPKSPLSFKSLLILLISGVPMGLTGIFYNQSLKYVDASIAIILLLQFTWIGIVIQYFLDKNVPTRKNLMATILILAGSIFASGILYSSITFSLVGYGWGLLAALSFASFIYISGRSTIPVHPIRKSALMSTGATILVFFVLPPDFLLNGSLYDGLLPYALFFAFFGSFLPPLLFNIGMPKVGSGLGNILSASELPTAVIMSTLILKEHVTFLQWMGVSIILLGIAFPNLQKKEKTYAIKR